MYSRIYAMTHPEYLFIFTDNTDRNSGKNRIPANCYYSRVYGEGHHYPNVTTAVLRGLENAYPISTQRYYRPGRIDIEQRWRDSDIEEFRSVISSEMLAIKTYILNNRPKKVLFPGDDYMSLFNREISKITKDRCPVIYNELLERVKLLNEFIKEYVK